MEEALQKYFQERKMVHGASTSNWSPNSSFTDENSDQY
jgi:hypothetical protein